jgi:hypothetical protein
VRNSDVNRDHPRAHRPSDHPATSLGPRGKNRATPPTIDHRERLWDRGAQSRPAHPLFFSKKTCRHQGDVEATHIDVRFTPKADIAQHRPHVRLVPIGHHLTAQ